MGELNLNRDLLGMYRRTKEAAKDIVRDDYYDDPKTILQDNVETIIRPFHGHYGPNGEDDVYVHYRGWTMKASRRKGDKMVPGAWLNCNCHGGKLQEKCVPCYDDVIEYRTTGKHCFRPQPFYAWNIIRYGKYHVTPNQNGNGTHLRYCSGKPDCPGCRQELEVVRWRHEHLDLDESGWAAVNDWKVRIVRKCASCRDGEILPTKAICPSCSKPIIMAPDKLKPLEMNKGNCPHCGYQGYMDLRHDCLVMDYKTGEARPGCGKPSYFDIYDCDLRIVQKPRAKGKGKDLVLVAHMPAPDVDDPDIIEAMKHPFQFKSYQYMSPENQAARLGIPNPYAEKK